MATTTNYGWTTPDDTALVKDGAAAIRTLGSSVDTTTKALNPETTLGDIAYRSSTANVKTRLGIGTTGQVLSVSGGVPAWITPSTGASFAGVSLYNSTNLSFSSGSGTNTTFDTELFDTNGYHSTSSNTDRITIPSGKDGYYLITARASWDASATGIRIGSIRKNAAATQLARNAVNNQTGNVDCTLTFSTVAYLVATDYVVFENYQDGVGALDLICQNTSARTNFSAIYLGA